MVQILGGGGRLYSFTEEDFAQADAAAARCEWKATFGD